MPLVITLGDFQMLISIFLILNSAFAIAVENPIKDWSPISTLSEDQAATLAQKSIADALKLTDPTGETCEVEQIWGLRREKNRKIVIRGFAQASLSYCGNLGNFECRLYLQPSATTGEWLATPADCEPTNPGYDE